ncbi:precorrin-6y C5,15-methyltransferase (decarboxylating) subunit CbiE [Alkaliphilus crotonatoxidans]
MNRLYVIGMGPGNPAYILPIACQRAKECSLLLGGRRNLEAFSDFQGERYYLKNLADAIKVIKENLAHRQVGVVVSGDTGFYSLLDYLKRHFEDRQLEVIPGISSFQYLYAKLKRPWHQTRLLSLHGREGDYLSLIRAGQSITLLTDSKNSPDEIARALMGEGLNQVEMIVGESLSYEDERIVKGRPNEIVAYAPYKMAVVVINYE